MGSAVDEREVVERVVEWLAMDCLNFFKGRPMAFALFLTVFFRDAALLEVRDDLVDIVSADLAMVKSPEDVPLSIQSIL